MDAPRWPGLLALALYAGHAAELLVRFPPANLLWSCNVASVLLVFGLLAGVGRAVGAGTLLLTLGNVYWAIDLAGGAELLPTAPLTHIGVWALGLASARRRGVPGGSSLAAALALALATVVARLVGPASENVNLAFSVPPGWETRFPSHARYLAGLGAANTAALVALEVAARRLLARSPRAATAGAAP